MYLLPAPKLLVLQRLLHLSLLSFRREQIEQSDIAMWLCSACNTYSLQCELYMRFALKLLLQMISVMTELHGALNKLGIMWTPGNW